MDIQAELKRINPTLEEIMTYARAKLIIWNPDAYDRATVREAAVWMLGNLRARPEDVGQATNLL